jgi:arylsulfatase
LDWKVSFAVQQGNIATGTRTVTNWAGITNLRMDPYEKGMAEGGEALKFFAQQMWLLVPIGALIKQFFAEFESFPYQAGTSLNAGGLSYGTLRMHDAMQRLSQVEQLHPTS